MQPRYWAEAFDEDGKFYVFDRVEQGSECAGPFEQLADADIEATRRNLEAAGIAQP